MTKNTEAKRQAIQKGLLALSERIKQEHDRHSVELTEIKNQVIDLSDEVGALSFSCIKTEVPKDKTITNLMVSSDGSKQSIMTFDINPVVDVQVEIDDGSGFVSLSNTGVFASHSYNINNQTTLVAGDSYTIRLTPVDGSPVCEVTFTASAGNFPAQVTNSFGPEYVGPVLPTAQNQNVTDASTGTTIRRLISGVRHEYSERSALNIDKDRYLANNSTVYDANTLSTIGNLGALFGTSSEVIWSNTNPDLVFGCVGLELVAYNIVTGVATPTGVSAFGFGPFEAGASANDRVLVTSSAGAGTMTLVDLSDLNNVQVIASATEPANRDAGHVSLDGNYVVVAYPGGATIYNSALVAQRTIPYGGHAGVAVDALGRQVYVGTDDAGDVFVAVLSDNTGASDYKLGFSNISGASHFSGNAIDRPGVIYGSFNTDFNNADGDNTSGFIGSLVLSPNSQTYEVWTAYYFQNHVYENTPKASVSKDGTCIVFTTPVAGGGATDYLLSLN